MIDFWDFGHELFKTTPETFPATFIAGDIFDTAIIEPRPPFNATPQTPPPALESMLSLIPAQGHISAIYLSSVFHLFNEARQLELAHRVAALLSPLPGSIIFGSHISKPEKGFTAIEGADLVTVFCHSPESWVELWEEQVFEKGSVKVEAMLHKIERPDKASVTGQEFFLLLWSITRL